MTPKTFFDGIKGLEPSEPIGAVLRIGRKDPNRGFPIERDRFYFVEPQRDESGSRPLHPAFRKFNGNDKLDERKTVWGNIYHATVPEAHTSELSAYKLNGWESPPHGGPVCRGDGEKASRWHADKNSDKGGHYREIKCPNELCEFRQRNAKGQIACSPFGRLYFILSWPEPKMLVKFEHKSWNNAKAMLGFFESVRKVAESDPPNGLGMSEWSIFGMPFVLTLSEKTNPKKKTRFPVVSMAATMSPVDFFIGQRKQIEEAGGKLPQLTGARSPEENEAEVIDAAHVELSAPAVPSEQGRMFE